MSVIFENSGQIDPRAITTLGINVKDEARSPIGYFGTGLKYAIAVLLRTGQGVVIHTGGRIYTFTLADVVVRGKAFQIVCMNGVELGFTTEFGKNWELWQAYRELWSNARDEDGRVYQSDDLPDLESVTQIVIDGAEFDDVHANRDAFLLLDQTPMFANSEVEVYNSPSEFVFYHGIRASRVPVGKKSRFTYNIIGKMMLTEDRTLAYSWDVINKITKTALESSNAGFLSVALTEEDENTLEHQLDYNQSYTQASETFVSTVGRLIKDKSGRVNDAAVKKFSSQTRGSITPEGRSITPAESSIIQSARDLAERLGFPNSDYEIRVADDLGDGVLAIAAVKEQKIVLSPRLISDGVPHTAQAIVEESIHIRHGYQDCSRQMQTYLFEQIMRLGLEAMA